MQFWRQLRPLTKVTIFVTCAAPVVLCLTSASQALVSDGRNVICVISWHIPLFGTMHMPHSSWWAFTGIWLTCLSLPPLLWISVGLSRLVTQFRRSPEGDYTR